MRSSHEALWGAYSYVGGIGKWGLIRGFTVLEKYANSFCTLKQPCLKKDNVPDDAIKNRFLLISCCLNQRYVTHLIWGQHKTKPDVKRRNKL